LGGLALSAGPRIVVNALSARVGGGLTYVTEQLSALVRVRPDLELTVLASTTNMAPLLGSSARVKLVRFPNLSMRMLYEQAVMPYASRRADVLYCPANFCPLVPAKLPIVLTLRNAHHFGPGRMLPAMSHMRKRAEIWLARASVRRADAVIVVSEALLADLRADGLYSSKVRVIRSGTPEWPPDDEQPPGLTSSDDFFLSLANDSPAKRLDDILTAWKTAFGSPDNRPSLVFAGRIEPARREAHRAIVGAELAGDLTYLGIVENRAHVKWLLMHARAMVSASELESFGLTVVEAGSLGCPAIVTDLPAHRETAEGEVNFFRPGDTKALARSLGEVGPRSTGTDSWAWRVSWDDNARELARTFDELIG
jgi:glycosyltransferase involved in cell wall biosynthesis